GRGGAEGGRPSEKQIRDVEEQSGALNEQVGELKKANGSTVAPAPLQPESTLNPDWIKTFAWRSIGPATMGGRITAISVYEADPTTYWVATASGGLVKTINKGVTFEHQFDQAATVSLGD